MIDIYICEDNKKHLELFKKYITNTILIENLDMKIALATSNPHELLEQISSLGNIGLFFLDIDLQSSINGLATAQQIRELQPRCFIIFITSHSEMSFLTFQYKTEALDFIIKDSSDHIKQKIHENLLKVEERYTSMNNSLNKTFTILQHDKRIAIDYNDIIFLKLLVIYIKLFFMLKSA